MNWFIAYTTLSTVLCAVVAIVFFVIARHSPQWHHAHRWYVSYAFFTLLFTALALDASPVGTVSELLPAAAFACLMLGFTYEYLGVREWRGLLPAERQFSVPAVALSLLFVAAALLGRLAWSIPIALGAIAVYPLLCLHGILSSKKRLNAGHRLASVFLALHPLTIAAVAVLFTADVLRGGLTMAALEQPLQAVYFMLPLGLVGAASFYLLGMVIELIARVRDSALRDPLTRLYNRRGFSEHAQLVHDHAARHDHAYSVVVCDLDNFKAINDTYGHEAGDRVLASVSEQLRRHSIRHQITARVGGEEFLLLLPDTRKTEACDTAEKLRSTIASTPIILSSHKKAIRVTASFGVAFNPGGKVSLAAAINRADQALYEAKRRGRNKIAFRPAA